MNKPIAIKLERVTKDYELHDSKPTLSEMLFSNHKGQVYRALDNVSLEIMVGERLGIIGRNGSGKTTLLKTITGITCQTSGNIIVNGKIVSLIDIEAGFHPEMTGRENLGLNASLIGMHRKEIVAKADKIIRFADLGDFIDRPLHTYSSGMILRLGFAIAIHTDPEIVVMDENISVGDKDFQKKIERKIEALRGKGKTFVLVSHNLGMIKALCERAIWLEKGKIKVDGKTEEVLDKYTNSFR